MNDQFSRWTPKRDFHLGAHIMNDLDINNSSNTIPPNCVVQPLLEVLTTRDIKKDEELFISDNRA